MVMLYMYSCKYTGLLVDLIIFLYFLKSCKYLRLIYSSFLLPLQPLDHWNFPIAG